MSDYMETCKIFPVGDGFLAGAGVMDHLVEVAAWLLGNADKPRLPDEIESEFLYVSSHGAFWLSWPYLRQVPIREPFAAIGSGAAYALGALALGATAKDAVKVAAQFDPSTGGVIDVVVP